MKRKILGLVLAVITLAGVSVIYSAAKRHQVNRTSARNPVTKPTTFAMQASTSSPSMVA